jgi:hypothetical protein
MQTCVLRRFRVYGGGLLEPMFCRKSSYLRHEGYTEDSVALDQAFIRRLRQKLERDYCGDSAWFLGKGVQAHWPCGDESHRI